MADAYRLLDQLNDGDDLMPSADGCAKDKPGSARRLARMLGGDYHAAELPALTAVADYLVTTQRLLIEEALAVLLSREPNNQCGDVLVGAGVGRFVVERIASIRGCRYLDFAMLLEAPPAQASAVAMAAPAVAAAKLAWITL